MQETAIASGRENPGDIGAVQPPPPYRARSASLANTAIFTRVFRADSGI